jgi:hypothetical protein
MRKRFRRRDRAIPSYNTQGAKLEAVFYAVPVPDSLYARATGRVRGGTPLYLFVCFYFWYNEIL